MAVLETIRVKFGLAVSIIIALGLLSFIISPNDIAALKDATNQEKVGNINGHEISAQTFESQKQMLSNLDSQYGLFGAQGQDKQQAINEIAWGSFMSEYLYDEYVRNAGFSVVDGEVVAAVKASFPSELRERTSDDSNLKDFLMDQVRSQLYMSKYSNVFAALANKSAVEVADEKDAANKSVDVDVVKVAYPEYAEVEVSDAEIESYYNTHKTQYKNFISTRDVEYAYFRVLPSAEDVAGARKEINLEADFDLLENVWVKAGDLSGLPYAIESFVNDNNSGVSELVQEDDNFFAVKVLEAANRSAEATLKCMPVMDGNAEEICSTVNAKNFEEVAAENGSQIIPLNLTNATVGQYPGFELAFDKKAGEAFVADFQGVEYIVLVEEKSAPVKMKNIALLQKDIIVSNKTLDSYQKLANSFASVAAGTYDGFVAALDSISAETAEATLAAESQNLGIINGTEKVTAWAFEASEGSCSKAFQINYDYFVVATLKTAHNKGYKRLSEVKDEVRDAVYQQKVAAATVESVKAQVKDATTLAAVASATGSAKRTISGLRFASNENDPVLTGAVAAAAAAGKSGVVGPVKGKDGVYFFEIKSDVKEEDLYDEADAFRAMMSDLQGLAYGGQLIKAGYMQYLQPEIEFHSTVKDERLKLYR